MISCGNESEIFYMATASRLSSVDVECFIPLTTLELNNKIIRLSWRSLPDWQILVTEYRYPGEWQLLFLFLLFFNSWSHKNSIFDPPSFKIDANADNSSSQGSCSKVSPGRSVRSSQSLSVRYFHVWFSSFRVCRIFSHCMPGVDAGAKSRYSVLGTLISPALPIYL